MKQSKHLPKFIGGTHNGKHLPEAYKVAGRWPGIFYLPTILSIEEEKSLDIDGIQKWRNPDDVYDLLGANYVFRERIDYKPKEEKMDTPISIDEFEDALR